MGSLFIDFPGHFDVVDTRNSILLEKSSQYTNSVMNQFNGSDPNVV